MSAPGETRRAFLCECQDAFSRVLATQQHAMDELFHAQACPQAGATVRHARDRDLDTTSPSNGNGAPILDLAPQ
jgi:hypothetical protein